MAYTSQQYQSALATVTKNGYQASDLDRFLQEDPNDIGRVGSAFAPQQQQGVQSTAAAPSNPAVPSVGDTTPDVPPSLAGLSSVVNPVAPQQKVGAASGTSALGFTGGGDGGGAIAGAQNGQLRPLGVKRPPMDSMALAGLQRRIY